MESPYFKSLLNHIAKDERFNGEMIMAKEEFERFAGPIYETDRSYDARINSFHNWYILDRPLRSQGKTPLRYFLEYQANDISDEDRHAFEELQTNVHSVFELLKFSDGQTTVRNLITNKKIRVEGMEGTEYIDKGSLFNSRLFTHEGKLYFSNYFLLHPQGVIRKIKVQSKKVRKSMEDPKSFLFTLVLFQSRWDQYKQMELDNIYRFSD